MSGVYCARPNFANSLTGRRLAALRGVARGHPRYPQPVRWNLFRCARGCGRVRQLRGRILSLSLPEPSASDFPMVFHRRIASDLKRLHLHLLSDSTGETLDMIAKACLAQFDDVEALRHFWPMVRSEGHLDRVARTMSKAGRAWSSTRWSTRRSARDARAQCRALGLHAVPVLDPVIDALVGGCSARRPRAAPGRQHVLDAAYFARVDAIQFTIAHDDGVGCGELGGGRHRPRRRLAHLEDADQHLSRQSRLQGRQYPARRRNRRRRRAVRAEASAGRRPDHQLPSG